MSNRHLYIAWTAFQRRQVSMQPYWGYKLYFIPIKSTLKLWKLIEYMALSIATLRILIKAKPMIVWVQVPQVPLLTAILVYKKCLSPSTKLVADCHNGTFRPPWSRWPLAFYQLNLADIVVVHNEMVADSAKAKGVVEKRIRVLEDVPAKINEHVTRGAGYKRPWLLFPASFSDDEPIEELFKGAMLASEITFVITGDPDRARRLHDLKAQPSNVELTGFLPADEFNRLLLSADAVIGLTRLEGVQLSVCNEALGVGKPMILSDTTILRKLFYKGGIFVNPFDPHAIADGCRRAVSESARLSLESKELGIEKTSRWLMTQADPLAKMLDMAIRHEIA